MKRRVLIFAAPDFFRFIEPQLKAHLYPEVITLIHDPPRLRSAQNSKNSGRDPATANHLWREECLPIARSVSLWKDLSTLGKLVYRWRRKTPDCILAHTPKGGLLGMLAGRMVGAKKRVYHIHGLRYETATGAWRRLLFHVEKLTCSWATDILCVSPSVLERARKDRLFSSGQARSLGAGSFCGIDTNHYRRSNSGSNQGTRSPAKPSLPKSRDGFTFAYLGRLARDKGLEVLAQAWHDFSPHYPNAQLIIVGEADPTDSLPEATFCSLPRVRQLGAIDIHPQFFEKVDAIILPSLREGLPQVLLEAASMECPMIGSRVTGIVDVIQEAPATGILVPPNDAQSLLKAMEQLLADSELCLRLGRQARQFVQEHFERSKVIAELERTYREIGVLPPSSEKVSTPES
ncbi:MAG: glycosyltransferase [Polyangiaceae bacterium]|nr:glycosyltransferase [Polyangiaceae bacterium]